LEDIKNRGVSIVYVSHRLEEIFKVADRVTVLRDGKKVGTKNINELNMDLVVKMMVGREISEMYPKESAIIGCEALVLKDVSKDDLCKKINLTVHEGEVVGLYGLIGAGRTELARLIFGLENMDEGEIYILNKRVAKASPSNLIKDGLGFLTEDRVNEGLCMNLSVKRNINRVSLNKIFPKGFISYKKEDLIAKKYINDLNIKTPSVNTSVMFLSGGNQQKVMFAHWMTIDPKILILDEPTKGVDVGARVEIYRMINSLKKNGVAILLISSDLPEIVGMSDRIYVMYKGKISGYFDNVSNSIIEDIASCAIGKEIK
jgi:ribose transport system ATP-binding protein